MGIVLKGGNVVELEPGHRVSGWTCASRMSASWPAGPDLQPQPDDEVLALSGKLVFPGLVSAHHRLHVIAGPGHAPSPSWTATRRRWSRCAGATRARSTSTPCRWRPPPEASRRSSAAPPPCSTCTPRPGRSSGSLMRVARGLHEVGVRGVLSYAVTDRAGAVGREEGLEETVTFTRRPRGGFRGQVGAGPRFTAWRARRWRGSSRR